MIVIVGAVIVKSSVGVGSGTNGGDCCRFSRYFVCLSLSILLPLFHSLRDRDHVLELDKCKVRPHVAEALVGTVAIIVVVEPGRARQKYLAWLHSVYPPKLTIP